MFPFAIIGVLYIVYIVTWFLIACIADCDVITFLSTYFGKSPAQEFAGKVIWVTGASSGIGEALVKNLATCNSRLAISARRKDELERVKRECLALNPKLKENDILVVDFDMLNYSVHESTFRKVLNHFGKLDLLVSNAGRSQRARWHNIEVDVDKDMFDLNVFSLINLNRIAIRHFFKAGNNGSLAITSSIAGIMGAPDCASYTGAKHALHGYFECLRNETRDKNIAITMLCPGPVFSNIVKEAFTNKAGEKVNKVYKSTERRMTADRCAYLCLVAIANKLEESWLLKLVNIKNIVTKVRGTRYDVRDD